MSSHKPSIKSRLTLSIAVGAALCGMFACEEDEVTQPREVPLAEEVFATSSLGTIQQGATEEQRETFARGEAIAIKRFSPEEGLGPYFNVTFCASCHEKPTLGGSAPRYRDFYLFGTLSSDGAYFPGPRDGVAHAYGVSTAPTRPGHDETINIIARRNPIPFFGTGAIAEIKEDAILRHADPDDLDGDGISGRPNYDQGFVGRFGRKSQTVSIENFIRGPLNNHLGITSDPLTNDQKNMLPVASGLDEGELERRLNGLTTREQAQAAAPSTPLQDNDDVPDPELESQDLFDLVSWAMLLGAPKPDPLSEDAEQGQILFGEIGCASCHVPALEGSRGMVPLYSDLLLHDMGDELDDGLVMGLAQGNEFRTTPLWGVVSTGPWLHDGRADTLPEAIAYHGGEAQRSADAYKDLTPAQQEQILAFLSSLGGADQVSEGLLPPDQPIPDSDEPGAPIPGLDDDKMALWVEGRRIFDRDFARTEGLGPLFNGDSCRACHFDPVIGGAGPLGVNAMRIGTWDDEGYTGPEGGNLIHKLSDVGTPRPEPLSTHNAFEPRQTPALFGIGLIDAISEETIIAAADPDDADGDGIRGVASYLPDGRLGRLGWKGGIPEAREFVRDALFNEVGLTLPVEEGYSFGSSTDNDMYEDPEVDSDTIDAITFYISSLAPLTPEGTNARGETLFTEVACASCHTPSMDSSLGPVKLYSDLLLHDISPEGTRGFPEGVAPETSFRTTPLWGMGRTGPYMHDGMASTVEAAIEAHDGEATNSRDNFKALSPEDREALLDMLRKL